MSTVVVTETHYIAGGIVELRIIHSVPDTAMYFGSL